MELNIEPSWKSALKGEFDKDYYKKLIKFIQKEYAEKVCCPPENQIFEAFKYTPFDSVKVVILGQDPYHNAGEANGLAFSVNNGMNIPPSLRNIFKELYADIGKIQPTSGSLEHWAKQGVLLLNSTLTVGLNNPGSHQKKGWEVFTDVAISKLSENRKDLVFLLWGAYAKKKGSKIDKKKHLVLTSGHPSPMSAINGHWFGNNHFSLANKYLKELNKELILW